MNCSFGFAVAQRCTLVVHMIYLGVSECLAGWCYRSRANYLDGVRRGDDDDDEEEEDDDDDDAK